jgi:hypothetical protein
VSPIGDWLKILELKPRHIFGALLFLGILIFVPKNLAEKLGIFAFRQTIDLYLGVAFIGLFCLWLVQIYPILQNKFLTKHYQKAILGKLETLSQDEWLLLTYCLEKHQQTVSLEFTDRDATALATKGLLKRPSGSFDVLAWPFMVPDYVWKELLNQRESFVSRYTFEPGQFEYLLKNIDNRIHRHDRFYF